MYALMTWKYDTPCSDYFVLYTTVYSLCLYKYLDGKMGEMRCVVYPLSWDLIDRRFYLFLGALGFSVTLCRVLSCGSYLPVRDG